MAKKKKPAEYYFGKFLNALRNEDAEIKFDGTKFSSKQGYPSIKNLVMHVCFKSKTDEEAENKVNTITRAGKLAKENSRKGKISEIQKNVIKQLNFYFTDYKPRTTISVNRYNYHISRNNLSGQAYEKSGERSASSNVRDQFYVKQCEILDYIYPDLTKKIVTSVYNNLTNDNIKNIYTKFNSSPYPGAPFPRLTDKLYDGVSGDHDEYFHGLEFTNIFRPKNLDEFINNYMGAISRRPKTGDNRKSIIVAPDYDLRCTHLDPTDVFVDSTENLENYFENIDNCFDKFRVDRIESKKPELLKMDVDDWPKWTIEHVILAQWEYICLREQVENIIFNEIYNSIHFELNRSSDGDTIETERTIENYQNLGKIISKYRFPGGIEKHLNLERYNILEGDFYKYSNELVARNTSPDYMITLKILKVIIELLGSTLCSHIGFNKQIEKSLIRSVYEKFDEELTMN